jgi:hypothetical protein
VSESANEILSKTKKSLHDIKSGLGDAGLNCNVFLGAQGPKMIEASLDADGVLLNYTDLEMAKWAKHKMEERKTADFKLGLFPPAFIGSCESIKDNFAIAHSAAMVAIGLGKSVAERFGLSSSLKEARKQFKKSRRIDRDVVASLDDDVLKRFAFCGSTEQLGRYVKSLEGVGYTNVVFGPPIGLSRKGVENLVNARKSS